MLVKAFALWYNKFYILRKIGAVLNGIAENDMRSIFTKNIRKIWMRKRKVIDRLLQAEDQEIWLEKLRKKARSMRNLYIENEALLNLYVRPFLSGEVLLNDELADCFLHEIIDCRAEGYEDDLAFREVTELLNGYFRETKNRGGEIWCLNILGGLYNAGSGEGDGERSQGIFPADCGAKGSLF